MTDEQQEEFTPERAAEVADAIAKQWKYDWGAVLEGVILRTGLTRADAFNFMLLRQMAALANAIISAVIPPKFHENCKACQENREFHEAQYENLKLVNKHLREEHGDGEDWQQK